MASDFSECNFDVSCCEGTRILGVFWQSFDMQPSGHNLSQHLGKLIDFLVTPTENARQALKVYLSYNDRHASAP